MLAEISFFFTRKHIGWLFVPLCFAALLLWIGYMPFAAGHKHKPDQVHKVGPGIWRKTSTCFGNMLESIICCVLLAGLTILVIFAPRRE